MDVLPPNLEALQLQFQVHFTEGSDQDRAARLKRLEQLAIGKTKKFPRLKRVVWWTEPPGCWVSRSYGPESDMEFLAATFHDVSVQFEWLITSYFYETPLGGDIGKMGWENL
ncbi:hypothetical protein BP6252_10909 [Coleophoma cylindrospora]|uniref:Uncharacterized protein n=1 Tax=Coleophoma cylindrospora TaxID=1849047 RepID=A0A3D8QPI5_9HELO|nr:hypothetical protein BP6252_10909 [Coleophoma cylindrospora]